MYPDIQLVILAGRAVNPELRAWSGRFDHVRAYGPGEGGPVPDFIACRRNAIFRWFRDGCSLPWLLMVDDDMVPVAETEDLLTCEADVAAAACVARSGHPAHPHTISVACVKVSRRAVQAIPAPWFAFTFSPDGTRLEMCECQWFWRKSYRAGFRAVHAGLVGHRISIVALPPGLTSLDGDRPPAGIGEPANGAAGARGSHRPDLQPNREVEHV